MSKSNKLAPRKKFTSGLSHHGLGRRSTRSLMAGDTYNSWKDIELRIYLDSFFTSFQISPMNTKGRYQNPLNPKANFEWVYGCYSNNSTKRFYKWDHFF